MTRIISPALIKIGDEWVKVGTAHISPETKHLYEIVLDEDAPVAAALKALMESKLNNDIRVGLEPIEPPEPSEDEYKPSQSRINVHIDPPAVTPIVLPYRRPIDPDWQR